MLEKTSEGRGFLPQNGRKYNERLYNIYEEQAVLAFPARCACSAHRLRMGGDSRIQSKQRRLGSTSATRIDRATTTQYARHETKGLRRASRSVQRPSGATAQQDGKTTTAP